METGYITLTVNEPKSEALEMTCADAANEIASGIRKLATVLHPKRIQKELPYERLLPTLQIKAVAESLDKTKLEAHERRFIIMFEMLDNRPIAMMNNVFTWLKSVHNRPDGFITLEVTYRCATCEKDYNPAQMHICLKEIMQSGYYSALEQHRQEEGIDNPK